MNPLDSLGEEIIELVESFASQAVWGDLTFGLTQYMFFFFVAMIALVVVLFAFKRRQASSIVPHGFFVNAMEWLVDFIRTNMIENVLGDRWRQHFPFLATIFLTVLFSNLIGMIPGCKPGTGTISITGMLAVCSFCYFVYCGCKAKGVAGYVKSLAPEGVIFPLNCLVWLIEVISNFLRIVTLAIRLFCNMFAGHIVMGTFAILASLFVQPLLQAFSAVALGEAACSIFWILLLIIIYIMEIFVACVQSYVFTLLSAVYIQTAEAAEH